MSDLISRKAVLKNIEKTRQSVQMMDDTHRASIIMNGMYLCEKAVINQPTAEPKTGKWIPCSEGYPKMDERVLVNLDGKDDIRTWDCMANRGDSYFWEDEFGFFHDKYEVLYWMRIPKLSEGE